MITVHRSPQVGAAGRRDPLFGTHLHLDAEELRRPLDAVGSPAAARS